jgi:peptidoglycan L-alanyl-D-glutamate endopeptidase CwlK
MFKFGKTSRTRLDTCDQDLVALMETAIADSPMDFSIVCGHRSRAEQDRACADGLSKTPWPTSKHNCIPSRAVDVVPLVNGAAAWHDKKAFADLAHHILAHAEALDINVRWGGDWDRDGEWKDERFLDMPHFELMG